MKFKKTLLIVGLGGILLFSGCGKKNSGLEGRESSIPPERAETLSDKNLEDDIRRMVESSAVPVREETTHDKIESALKKGTITKEEAVTEKIKASLAPAEVEKKYQGGENRVGRTSLNDDLQWAINNWDSLDEETRIELEPYIVAPDDPKYFDNKNKETSFNFIKPAYANYGMTEFIIFNSLHFDGAGKIYHWGVDKAKAERIKAAMEKAWPKYKALLGMAPSRQIKIYYTNTGTDYGVATWKGDFCEIKIGSNKPEKFIEPSTAHELFHCFQYFLSPTYIENTPDPDWITEATAVWAEDYIYPAKNSEHEYLSEFYPNLHKDRLSIVDEEEYGSYMWFFFLSQYLGDDKHVNTALQKGKNGKIRDAVMTSITNYDNTYAEFALYNWNQEPWETYQDNPKYPDNSPSGNSTEDLYFYDKIVEDMPVNLSNGSIKYVKHFFDRDLGKVNRVKFDFKTLTTDQKFQRQALVKIGDVWTREDWNNLTEKEYCRKDEAERVRAVILVYSNADLKAGKSAVYNIDTEGDCQVKKKGSLNIVESSNWGGTKTINVNFSLDEVVEYDLDQGNYVVVKRTANCNSTDTGNLTMYGNNFTSVIKGIGSFTEAYELDGENDIRFSLSDDGKSGYIHTGLNPNVDAWVTQTVSVSEGGGYTEKAGCGGSWASRYELLPGEIFEDKIKGNRVIPITGGSIVIDFEYDLP